ncbi:MAG: recombination-associated protein RdgC [Lentisphaeria bacterium]|nr:recombination-associated protein RdgC [Lentisphaeria bacterium]
MAFESGTTALIPCTLSGKMPKDYLARLAKNTAGRLDDVRDEPVIGWVSGRHLLENEIDETTAVFGGHLYVNLRKAERKIPAQLLNAICRREELAYMQANDTITVPKKEKKRIKEDAIEHNLMKMPPVLSAVPIVVDMATNMMYVGSASLKSFDLVAAEFLKVMEIEPIPVNIRELMMKLFKKSELDLPDMSFNGRPCSEPTPGRDFLTWLWYFSETKGGLLKVGDLGNFNLIVEGPLTFAITGDDAPGASESTVKKGCPQISAEAKAALAVGKKLRKAKILLARGDVEKWTFSFDADAFTFSGLSLPETESMEINTRFEERVLSLNIFLTAFEAYFQKFASDIMSGKAAFQKEIVKWAADRESL